MEYSPEFQACVDALNRGDMTVAEFYAKTKGMDIWAGPLDLPAAPPEHFFKTEKLVYGENFTTDPSGKVLAFSPSDNSKGYAKLLDAVMGRPEERGEIEISHSASHEIGWWFTLPKGLAVPIEDGVGVSTRPPAAWEFNPAPKGR